ncbi:MAG: mismatch-specific DNA-glycosylase [Syntrophomonadaceae bacterium]|nr:mismatch-specific DNA-glycosylase [Syntrophomonadaceae bacterium]
MEGNLMLPDVLRPNLKVVFCGTAAGDKSAMRKAYYAGPGNKFWSILYRTGLTPVQLEPKDYEKLLDNNIGLTDLAKGVSGSDSKLKKSNFDAKALKNKILIYGPNVLCFNGKKAAQEFLGRKDVDYGLQNKKIGKTLVFVAPSTSGAANGFWDEKYYIQLAVMLHC